MAAGGVYTLNLSNGQSISCYQAANQTVNSAVPCNIDAAATSTTVTTDFAVGSDCMISKIVVAAALTAGGITFYDVTESRRSNKVISNLEIYLVANALLAPPAIGFRKGHVYRILQAVAGNA
jgi:hypothetical protein